MINADTKRRILQSNASNYDLLNINAALLNRARFFMQTLQCNKSLGWDTKISNDDKRTWKNICVQVNKSPVLQIDRSMGRRDEDYELHAYTDSSKQAYGAVLFLYNTNTCKSSFLYARNRLVNKQLESKSIPSLEMQGVVLGVEELSKASADFTGPSCAVSLKIKGCKLFTDSASCLGWISS